MHGFANIHIFALVRLVAPYIIGEDDNQNECFVKMKAITDIDTLDKSQQEDNDCLQQPLEKDFYTPEEAYELVMSDVKSIYDMKDAI